MLEYIIQGCVIGDKVRWRCPKCLKLQENYAGFPVIHICVSCGVKVNILQ